MATTDSSMTYEVLDRVYFPSLVTTTSNYVSDVSQEVLVVRTLWNSTLCLCPPLNGFECVGNPNPTSVRLLGTGT